MARKEKEQQPEPIRQNVQNAIRDAQGNRIQSNMQEPPEYNTHLLTDPRDTHLHALVHKNERQGVMAVARDEVDLALMSINDGFGMPERVGDRVPMNAEEAIRFEQAHNAFELCKQAEVRENSMLNFMMGPEDPPEATSTIDPPTPAPSTGPGYSHLPPPPSGAQGLDAPAPTPAPKPTPTQNPNPESDPEAQALPVPISEAARASEIAARTFPNAHEAVDRTPRRGPMARSAARKAGPSKGKSK